MLCSTNAIESLNARFRRAVRARGHFPSEQAALKTLYLVTRSLDPKGTGQARWTMRWNQRSTHSPSPSPTACRPPKTCSTQNAGYTEIRTLPSSASSSRIKSKCAARIESAHTGSTTWVGAGLALLSPQQEKVPALRRRHPGAVYVKSRRHIRKMTRLVQQVSSGRLRTSAEILCDHAAALVEPEFTR